MMARGAPLPEDERERLTALREFGILDTPVEPEFDRLTALAAHICNAPMALISLVDAERQWFKSAYGLNIRETPREDAFCAHAILSDGTMVIPDATADDRFKDSPLVTGGIRIRSYAGAPIKAEGHRLGALCAIHTEVTQLDERQITALELLAAQVASLIETKHQLIIAEDARFRLEEKAADLMFARDTLQSQADQLINMAEERDLLNRRNDQSQRFIQTLLATMPIPIFARDTDGVVTHANPAYSSLFNSPDGIIGKHVSDILPDYYAEAILNTDREMFRTGQKTEVRERRLDYGDGREARDIVVSQSLLVTDDGTFEGVVGGIMDVTAERTLRTHLEELASTDPLTGAFNRRAFTRQALNEIKRCQRLKLDLSIIMFDLDHFKQVNDTHGHLAGDAALKEVSTLFQSTMRRPTDFLGRMGGEEFAILAVDCCLKDARILAERLRKCLDGSPVTWGESKLHLTASFGVAQLTGNGQKGLELALRQADEALYAAKENGRNRVYMWSEADEAPVTAAA
jgi:diguanylate cyclase (GGDEF)-like protein/PAS domain S-box-containing protein